MTYTGMCHWTGYGFWPLCPKQGKYIILSVCPKQGVYFVICPKQGPKMESVAPHRVGILWLFLS